ncbi:MAG: hypothetical protein ABIN25_14715 [Ginsengibacter sp.]
MLSEEAKKIAEEAKRKGMWLYDPQYKKWYSPEDFRHIFTYANTTLDFLKAIQIRHPEEGMEAGFKTISLLQAKLQQFSKAILEYYKKREE